MERTNTRKGAQSTAECSKCYDNFHFYRNITDALIIPLIFIFYLVVKRLMITTNFAMKIKNLVVNHKSPVKSNTQIPQF